MDDEWYFLPRESLQELFNALGDGGRQVVGPRVRDGAIVYESLSSAGELPWGMGDIQGPGRYRLERRAQQRCFAWANGPGALKPLLFAARERLWRSSVGESGLRFEETVPEVLPTAVVGVRSCDIEALALHDRHFRHGPSPDCHYEARRSALLIVAADCTHPADTCFCVSTGDGPAARGGYDLRLHEREDGFLVRSGSEEGARLVAALPLEQAGASREAEAERVTAEAARRQKRRLPSRQLRHALFERLDHPRWDAIAQRCLACGNCTQVCPTCFCHRTLEEPSLDGRTSEHWREWDSCFGDDHSRIHGTVIRAAVAHRYRQWVTHKLAGWHDQFGRSGCVGCGRCVTWCPVGIDLTEEVTAMVGDREGEGGHG